MNEKFMQLALDEARKSFIIGDVPVGAVIVKNNKIISKAHNLKEKNKNAINHAEIIAIDIACRKLKTWHLEECELYVTMEPCLMCTGAIIQSRIQKVYFSVDNVNFGFLNDLGKYFPNYAKTINVEKNICASETLKLLKQFFELKRKK